VQAHLDRIDQLNGKLNAIVTIAPDVLDQARQAETLTRAKRLGPLHGLPLTIKDTIATAGIRTTSGSRVRKDFVPKVDAPAVARLKAAGAIILGKTNTPEMAIPYETDNAVFGRTNNPYDLSLTPGGSSGGEAAAIASCLSPGGVGSDLSGSIRVPAHFCGIVGLKPSSDRIPMLGHVPVVSGPLAAAACLGPMARVVADVSLLFSVLATEAEPSVTAEQLKSLRVCWYDFDGVTPVSRETKLAVRAAVDALSQAGVTCVERRPPAVDSGSRLWVELFAEASAKDLREFYSGKEELAGPLVSRILEAPRRKHQQGPEDWEKALQERDRLRQELLSMMDDTPVIIAPVGATAAFPHHTNRVDVEGESVSVFRAFSYSQTYNVFDLPAVVVRAGETTSGLPLGLQIVGKPFSEDLILAVAAIVEAALGGWRPPSNAGTDPI
ncbi:MAG TPA: amidase, partial [Pyrinomonadaceae bacterium]|nr:amidase [Pyrinomonadaceae bacterium]